MALTTIVDSIAIELLSKNAILASVGNEVHLHTSRGTHVLPFKLHDKVHGIKVEKSKQDRKLVLIYGEKEFLLIECNNINRKCKFKQIYRGQLTDWISNAHFLEESNEFLLLTAHSVLLRLAYECDKPDLVCRIIEKYSCTDKSTLYCSFLHGDAWQDLIVFGGNAFGELLIWQPSEDKANETCSDGAIKKVQLLQRIQMHNGVIFSIDYNEEFKLLTTTSDDRSIRFWSIDKESIDKEWIIGKPIAIASGYGHVARVFQGKILSHSNQPYAITVGEDSFFCLWRCNGELLYKRRQHFGAVIWNVIYAQDTKTLYTVGSTGNLLAYNLNDILEESDHEMQTMPQVDGLTEYVAKVKFLSADKLLVGITNKNRLIYRRDQARVKEKDTNWHLIEEFKAFKCTVLEVYNNYIAICGYKRVIIFKYDDNSKFTKLYDGEILSGLIRAFHFLNSVEHFLISDEMGNCMLLKGADMLELKKYPLKLPQCKERWLTAALLIEGSETQFLLLSNRQGNLLLYKFDDHLREYTMTSELRQPHGNLGATSFRFVECRSGEILMQSAGHDGALRLLCIKEVTATLHPYARQVVPVAWVERLIAIDGHNLLLGFNDKHFVVWSREYDLLLEVPCGGGHRCWHYNIWTDEEEEDTKWLSLAFIKNKQVLMHKLRLFNNPKTEIQLPLRNSWHVRPCNICQVLENEATPEETILISAGDDNLIKVFTYMTPHNASKSQNGLCLKERAEIHSHISNIRAMRVVPIGPQQCLIFTGGGRAQLCITLLNFANFGFQEMLNHTLNSSRAQHEKGFRIDPETRIMACDVLATTSNSYMVYLGCSDGYVRRLCFDDRLNVSSQMELHYGRCVLQVRLIKDLFVLVAGTDGVLRFYDLDLKETPFMLTHHASGVNALDILYDDISKTLHILTGGDDQSVAYTKLNVATPLSMTILKNISLKNQHTAQVTAAALHLPKGDTEAYAITSGVDQNIFKFNVSTEKVESVFHSCISDIKGLCINNQQMAFIYGCGLQICSLNS